MSHPYRRIGLISSLVPLVVAVLGVTAWLTGRLQLASLSVRYIPMAPITAVAFLLVSPALLLLFVGHRPIGRETIRGIAWLLFAIGAIEITQVMSGLTILNLPARLSGTPGEFGGVPLARMSPLTAGALIAVAIAFIGVTGRSVRIRDTAGLTATGVLVFGLIVAVGYAYGAPVLYGGNIIPVAVTTAFAFVGTGAALVMAGGPSVLPLRPFVRGATRALAAERLHQELNARSTYVIESTGAGVWELDLRTGVTRWSKDLAAIMGFPPTPHETTIDGFRERIHPDDRAHVDVALTRLIERDAPYALKFRVVRPDGSVRWVSAKGRAVKDATATATQLLGIAMDVTDRVELEQQLAQSQKLESLGQLAGSIAHDFNNILTAVMGFSDLLLDTLPVGDARNDATEIKKAAESGSQLTRQLLAFSRQQTLEPTRLDLNQVITGSQGILQQLVGRAVRVEASPGPSIGGIWADAGQMQRVFVNLAVNARDAMPKGGLLRIETSMVPGDRDHPDGGVVLVVTDTGVGMSPETRARIFEPFFTTKAPQHGTGLGLSTVYGIVQQTGATIEVSSEVGKGTTFRISFPALPQATRESSTPTEADAS
jgi:PAS domain S-box-containing protein